MDQELLRQILSQGIVASLLFFALKWALKDRDKGWETAAKEGQARIALLEKQSSTRTDELIALRSEFAEYRKATQSEISAIHAKHNDQLVLVTIQYNKQLEGLQTEIRGLYKTLLDAQKCPMASQLPAPSITAAAA